MNLKNIYHNELFRRISITVLALFSLFIGVAINDDIHQINFIYYLYVIFAMASFALGYLEMANVTVLGMGITRFSIFKKFNMMILFILIVLLILSLYYDFLIVLSEKGLDQVNLGLLIFLSFIVCFSGQVGLLLANLRINKYFGSLCSGVIFIGTIIEINSSSSKLIINIFLGAISAILIIVNYALIKNINLQKYF